MEPYRHRAMRKAHARLAYFCTCGKIVHGNGGKAQHADMHERKGEGFYFTSEERFWKLHPQPAGPVARAIQR